MSRGAIIHGIKDLQEQPRKLGGKGVRRAGGGRKKPVARDATLKSDLEKLIDPVLAAIRSRHCVGRARAFESWRKNWFDLGIK